MLKQELSRLRKFLITNQEETDLVVVQLKVLFSIHFSKLILQDQVDDLKRKIEEKPTFSNHLRSPEDVSEREIALEKMIAEIQMKSAMNLEEVRSQLRTKDQELHTMQEMISSVQADQEEEIELRTLHLTKKAAELEADSEELKKNKTKVFPFSFYFPSHFEVARNGDVSFSEK